MFPVSVWSRIESKRFVEEETQRKRLGSVLFLLCSSREKPRDAVAWLFGCSAGFLDYAPLGMTQLL